MHEPKPVADTTSSRACFNCGGSGRGEWGPDKQCMRCRGAGVLTRPIGLRFGEPLIGIYASEDNPQRRGLFVREGKRTGKMNPGAFIEMTDGRGRFWTYPPESVERDTHAE